MASFRTLDDMGDVKGKRVLVRVDFNLPMKNGRATDTTRIERVAPTIRDLSDRGAKVVLVAHYERPKGKRVPELSLAPIAPEVAEVIGRPVGFVDDCVGEEAAARIGALGPGGILLLENTRFHKGEEENDRAFAAELAKLGDFYVNDAFSAAHRAHASTEAVAHLLPALAGRTMAQEMRALELALARPERPLAGLVGGAKVSTKIDVLTHLVTKMDRLIIGGGMANTFLAAQGLAVGRSLHEPDALDTARGVMELAGRHGCELLLPQDVVVADAFAAGARHEVVPVDAIPADRMALDIGPATIARLKEALGRTRTLLWNGPVGAFEIEPFAKGTFALAREAADLTDRGVLVTVAGGGDTVAALNAAGVKDRFTYVSTAGGAFLEWLEGKELPGVAALLHEQNDREGRRVSI